MGKHFLVLGTGMIFFVSQMFTAVSAYVVGIIMNSKTKMSTIWGLSVPVVIGLTGFLCSLSAEYYEKTPFKAKLLDSHDGSRASDGKDYFQAADGNGYD